jgi:uncharacterized protein YndB with AHSA1/START domain
MLLKIGIAIVVLIVALVVYVVSRPADFRIERSALISAPSEAVFPLINDFHQWKRWSPWEKLDPDMKTEFSGPAVGPGSSYAWQGNGKAGEGRMTIDESKPTEFVSITLEFAKPMKATNKTTLSLSPVASGTMVKWEMTGRNGFMGKAFSTFMNMDKMVGGDFEKGLAALNTEAQTEAKK